MQSIVEQVEVVEWNVSQKRLLLSVHACSLKKEKGTVREELMEENQREEWKKRTC